MPDKEVANLEAHLFQRRVLPWTQLLGYAPERGHLRHRQAMAAWLTHLGMPADPDHIVLTAGAQHGLATTRLGAAQAGRHAARRGPDVLGCAAARAADALEAARRRDGRRRAHAQTRSMPPAARRRARVLYCMPRLQNPTSAVMSETPSPSDRGHCREVSADGHRGRHLRIPVAGTLRRSPADPASDGLRHQPVEEPVPRAAARLCRRAARHPGEDRACRVGDDDQRRRRSALIC